VQVTFLAANALRIISDVYYDKVENSLSCGAERGNFDHDQSDPPDRHHTALCSRRLSLKYESFLTPPVDLGDYSL
jgi:hypothetical protein